MLDYAANVVAHWPPGELRTRFAERAAKEGSDPDTAVLALLGSSDDDAIDVFWQSADANMAARRIRLVFVADVIPSELLRIIEFLNESFVRAEVFGVEVRQFVGEGHQTLVPRVVGRTATADQVKRTGTGPARTRRWTVDALREEALDLGGSAAQRLVDSVISWSARHGHDPSMGAGKGGPIYIEAPTRDGGTVKIASCNVTGYVLWYYNELALVPPFDAVDWRLACNRRLNAIPGVHVDDRQAYDAKWPAIRLEWLGTDDALDAFYEVIEWVAQSVAGATAGGGGPGAVDEAH